MHDCLFAPFTPSPWKMAFTLHLPGRSLPNIYLHIWRGQGEAGGWGRLPHLLLYSLPFTHTTPTCCFGEGFILSSLSSSLSSLCYFTYKTTLSSLCLSPPSLLSHTRWRWEVEAVGGGRHFLLPHSSLTSHPHPLTKWPDLELDTYAASKRNGKEQAENSYRNRRPPTRRRFPGRQGRGWGSWGRGQAAYPQLSNYVKTIYIIYLINIIMKEKSKQKEGAGCAHHCTTHRADTLGVHATPLPLDFCYFPSLLFYYIPLSTSLPLLHHMYVISIGGFHLLCYSLLSHLSLLSPTIMPFLSLLFCTFSLSLSLSPSHLFLLLPWVVGRVWRRLCTHTHHTHTHLDTHA